MDEITVTNTALLNSGGISLLLGTAFRLGFPAIIDYFKTKQEAENEEKLVRLSDEMESKRHSRDIEMMKAQRDAGVEVLPVPSERLEFLTDDAHFTSATASVYAPSRFKIVDFINSMIRPGLAAFCIVVWGISLWHRNYVLSPWDVELIGVTLGVFIGSRIKSTGN
jgi:hypothetical protein